MTFNIPTPTFDSAMRGLSFVVVCGFVCCVIATPEEPKPAPELPGATGTVVEGSLNSALDLLPQSEVPLDPEVRETIKYVTVFRSVCDHPEPETVVVEESETGVRSPRGLLVADVSAPQGPLEVTSYPLEFEGSVIQTEGQQRIKLRVRTVEEWVDVTLESEAVAVREKHKVLKVRVGAGVFLDTSASLSARAHLDWLYPHPNLAVLSPSLGVGFDGVVGGVDVAYNLGGPLPVLDDMWLRAGVSADRTGVAGSFGVSTRF